MVPYGFGKHIGNLSPSDVERIELNIYISELFYNISLSSTKMSVLLFYVRIFTTTKLWFRMAVWILGFMCVGWGVATCFLGAFQCVPPAKSWQPELEGTCRPQNQVYIGAAVPNVVIDFFLLILPLPVIKSLNTSLGHKFGIASVLMLGYWYFGSYMNQPSS